MKKKIFLIIVLALVLCYVPSVFAADITACNGVGGLGKISIDQRIPDTVHTIILVIQIAVPVVLVILGMLDLFKGITAQKEDEIKKSTADIHKKTSCSSFSILCSCYCKDCC